MRFFSTLALVASASAAATGLTSRGSDNDHGKKCLKQKDVDYLVNAYKSIINKWEAPKADFIADQGFFDYSDSINTIAGLPTGFPIFPNKEAFVAYQTATPDNLPLVIVEVGPWNCNQITVIWTATFTKVDGAVPLPVRGIAIIEGSYNKSQKDWEIQSLKVELNSMNFYRNTGGVCYRPEAPTVEVPEVTTV
ncbi:hypothetical protein B0T16DRAFT_372713 [Cercophora newfieldiana]|uniref:NTF2-like domain-containing protein n=1 Tax=Cercophora newfieldiana TaxID=92897 RepID=A0AA39YEL2_9PEZI|nr:hypothetical protein B0T16DRAFT_372713 [Cercophora newfieldiana]